MCRAEVTSKPLVGLVKAITQKDIFSQGKKGKKNALILLFLSVNNLSHVF